MSKLIQITTWADEGIDPDFTPGRWVQLGKPTLLNFFLTGLPGGKVYFSNTFPFVRFEKSKVVFSNHKTTTICSTKVAVPSGFGPDGYVKALFGQRILVD